MNKNIILVRHGESQGNKMGIYQGITNLYGLTLAGKQQILEVANIVNNLNFYPQKLFYSPLIRSKETAIILNNNLPSIKELEESELLKEIDMGLLNGMRKDIVKKIYFKEMELIKNGTYGYELFKGETIEHINKRILEVESLLDTCIYKDIIVVSHNGFIRSFIKNIGINLNNIEYKNGSILMLKKSNFNFNLIGCYHI